MTKRLQENKSWINIAKICSMGGSASTCQRLCVQ